MRPRFWRKPAPLEVDMSAAEEATAARRRAEARWSRVHDERRKQAQAAAHARRVLAENHFAPKIRRALEGR